jgi:hypothetical protein
MLDRTPKLIHLRFSLNNNKVNWLYQSITKNKNLDDFLLSITPTWSQERQAPASEIACREKLAHRDTSENK